MQSMAPSIEAKIRSKWLAPMLSGAIVLVLILTGALWFARRPGHARNPVSVVALANDGLPHTPAEINDWYVEPAPGQNAATFFSQGFNALNLRPARSSPIPLLGQAKLPPLGTPLPAPMKSALDAFLQSNQEALQLFNQGAGHDQSRYPVDLSPGFETLLPHLTQFKSALQFMELAAISHAEGHDGKQAAQDVLIALALVRSLEIEPSLLSQLMRAANVSLALAALEQTLNRTGLPQESLIELRKALHKLEDTEARGEGFNRAMVAERATWMAMLGSPQKLTKMLNLPGVDISAEERSQIVARLDKGNYLNEERFHLETTFQQLLAARQAAFPDRLKTGDLIQQRTIEAADKKLMISVFLLPGLATPPAKEAAALAQFRLGLTAVALEQFRAAHEGRYPDALAELASVDLKSATVDPFDGQSLRYRKENRGYILYSIGPDLRDDSGWRAAGRDGDIVFAVVTPTKPGH
jgi:hypothetical protein